jgi:hypothetical protein
MGVSFSLSDIQCSRQTDFTPWPQLVSGHWNPLDGELDRCDDNRDRVYVMLLEPTSPGLAPY